MTSRFGPGIAAILCGVSVAVVAAGSSAPAATHAAGPAAIFFYGWWGNPAHDGGYRHWQQNGHTPPADIASSFYPRRGAYSSSDQGLLDSQLAEIRAAGVREVVISWWGRGSFEDRRLGAVLGAAHRAGVVLAAHLEPYGGRTASSAAADLSYLAGRGLRDIYVYQPEAIAAADWAAVRRPAGVRLFAQTGRVGYAAAGRFDGVYTYDILGFGGSKFVRICRQAHDAGLLCTPSVGPGYVAARAGSDDRVKPRKAGRTYDAMWLAALRAHADGVTITSYNEWHEGTQLEPARERADYRDYRGAYGLRGPSAACAYLWRTAQWVTAFAAGRSIYGRALSRPPGGGCAS